MRVEKELRNLRGVNFKETLVVTLTKPMVYMFSDPPPKDPKEDSIENTLYFNSRVKTVTNKVEIEKSLMELMKEINHHG